MASSRKVFSSIDLIWSVHSRVLRTTVWKPDTNYGMPSSNSRLHSHDWQVLSLFLSVYATFGHLEVISKLSSIFVLLNILKDKYKRHEPLVWKNLNLPGCDATLTTGAVFVTCRFHMSSYNDSVIVTTPKYFTRSPCYFTPHVSVLIICRRVSANNEIPRILNFFPPFNTGMST
jgi:hypothetical protein